MKSQTQQDRATGRQGKTMRVREIVVFDVDLEGTSIVDVRAWQRVALSDIIDSDLEYRPLWQGAFAHLEDGRSYWLDDEQAARVRIARSKRVARAYHHAREQHDPIPYSIA